VGAEKSVIKNFTIQHGGKGILCPNVSMTIEHNCICHNKESGVHCLITMPMIRNNIIYLNGWTGIFCETVRSLRAMIEHNVIAENGESGIMLAGKTETIVQNNVFIQNRKYGIWVNVLARRSRIIYNDFYLNREVVNRDMKIDNTNYGADPQYDLDVSPAAAFAKPPEPLKQRGRDGTDIGLLGDPQ
jgi:parallel beta-helix repeat protein